MAGAIDSRLLAILACPRCHAGLDANGQGLRCAAGHEYPVADGVPVFLLPETEQTIGVASASYRAGQNGAGGPLYVETLGLTDRERALVERDFDGGGRSVDPVIAYLVGATSGLGYAKLIGNLSYYPIPRIPLEPGRGRLLLDIGCNWGRWSVSAARNGWRVVGLDPSLGALMAARRAFGDEHEAMFVCGDARFLPFKSAVFQQAFSYSVFQHFSEANAELALGEIGRVLCLGGHAKIQMAHRGGLRSAYVRRRRRHISGVFDVRYWSLLQMRQVFDRTIGPSKIAAEAFGGLGLLKEDWRSVSARAKLLILASECSKTLACFFAPLTRLADSVYVVSQKMDQPGETL